MITMEDPVFGTDVPWGKGDPVGPDVTWQAMNGHTLTWPSNVSGRPARGASWSARCADNCKACSEGYDLPDW